MFCSICLSKKNAEASKFLRNLKKYISKNNKLDFIMQIIYCIIHRCLYPLLISYFFVLLYQFLTMLTLPCSYNWQKFNNKMNEKRSQEYQSIGPEYVVTGQKNSQVLEFLLRWFCCLIFAAPLQKAYYAVFW